MTATQLNHKTEKADENEETLGSPFVRLTIYEETIDSRVYSKIRRVDGCGSTWDRVNWIEIAPPHPHSLAYFVFSWRDGVADEVINIRPSQPPFHETRDSISRTTTLAFPIPTQPCALYEWRLEGGSPGFQLTVRVKRKP